VPWKRADQIARYDKTGVPFICPIAGCTKNFSSRDRLDRHVRLGHTRTELEKTFPELKPKSKDKTVHWIGNYKLAPPFPCPPRAELPICTYHARHNTRCPICAEVLKSVEAGNPKPPLIFYDEVKVGVRQSDGLVTNVRFGLVKGTEERMPYIIDHVTGILRHIQLIAMCQDDNGNNWMACSMYWGYSDLKHNGFDFSQLESPLDQGNELIESEEVTYMPITRIRGHCYTLFCSKDEFSRKKKTDLLPSVGQVKFSRYRFSSETNRILGACRGLVTVAGPTRTALNRQSTIGLAAHRPSVAAAGGGDGLGGGGPT
jgi:hypothetical protein